MISATYPKIGSRARFIRLSPRDQMPEQGEGLIIAHVLDPSKRLMCVLHAALPNPDKNVEGNIVQNVNIDVRAIDPSPEYIKLFIEGAEKVKLLTDEGNGKAIEIVSKYNKMVEEVYDAFLGKPQVLDE